MLQFSALISTVQEIAVYEIAFFVPRVFSVRAATIPEKVTPTLTPAKSGSELTPATPTPLKSRNLPYIVEPNPESDSDSFWENSQLQATPTP